MAGAQRFSEDLDFDAFFTDTQLSRGAKVAYIHDRLTTLTGVYEIDRPRLMREVAQFTCAFTNELGMKDSVFVEFNLEAQGVGRVEVREAQSVIVKANPVQLPIYSLETLLAKKMKAFHDRGSGKDLYDIYQGLKLGADRRVLAEILEQVVASEALNYVGFAQRLVGRLSDEERLRRLHASTNPYVPRALRPDWAVAGRWLKDELAPLLVPDQSRLLQPSS